MQKEDLINLISEVLDAYSFKRKGNYWTLEFNGLTKIVNLQKSNNRNYYYINYGFNLKQLHLEKYKMHIYNRFGSKDISSNKIISSLLDLDNNISDTERVNGLKDIIYQELIPKIEAINSEQELFEDLVSRPHSNDIPLKVKQYFNLKNN